MLNITSRQLFEVIDNDIDDQPNKINEYANSLENTLNNVKNIPYEEVETNTITKNNDEFKNNIENNINESNINSYAANDVVSHPVTNSSEKGYCIEVEAPKIVEEGYAQEKPIKITEFMRNNIIEKISMVTNVQDEKVESNDTYESVTNSSNDSIREYERDDDYEYDFNESEEIDERIKELEKTSTLVLNLNKQAYAAEDEIAKSNEELENAGNRFNEVDEKYRNYQKLNNEYKEKIREALEKQKIKLEEEYSKGAEKIKAAEKQKEENTIKINDYNEKIRQREDATAALSEQIEKQRRILNVLGYNFENETEENKKIA